MSPTAQAADPFAALFSRCSAELGGAGLPWLRQARQAALARYAEKGLPSERDEEWRHTPTGALSATHFEPAPRPVQTPAALRRLSLLPEELPRLVFVDGHFAPKLSSIAGLPEGVTAGSLAEALNSGASQELLKRHLALAGGSRAQSLGHLNSALFADGAFLHLAPGKVLAQPLHVLFVSTASPSPVMTHSRVLIVAERGARAEVIEEYVSSAPGLYWTNMVTEVVLGEEAAIVHHKLQRESAQAVHSSAMEVRQARQSRFSAHSFALGGALVRNDVDSVLEDVGAECELNGLDLLRDGQLVDNHTFIDHACPHGLSRELYKGVLDGKSRSVFNGTIQIRQDAQKSSAHVYNKNLLLSEDGLVHTKPEFKIHANDVVAKHGAAIGQLSSDSLFYLRSRGIGREEARRFLVYAFASEMVGRVASAPVREALSGLLAPRLEGLA